MQDIAEDGREARALGDRYITSRELETALRQFQEWKQQGRLGMPATYESQQYGARRRSIGWIALVPQGVYQQAGATEPRRAAERARGSLRRKGFKSMGSLWKPRYRRKSAASPCTRRRLSLDKAIATWEADLQRVSPSIEVTAPVSHAQKRCFPGAWLVCARSPGVLHLQETTGLSPRSPEMGLRKVWDAYQHPDTGEIWWYNTETGEAAFEPPPGFAP